MKFIGFDGEIEIENNAIKIKKGKKDLGRVIRITDIISVTLKKPSFLCASGCIHIQVIGEKTYSPYANAANYSGDANAICFRKQKIEEALKFKEELDKAISEYTKSGNTQSIDANALKELKQLLDEGIITQEDFDKKKNKMLGL